MTWPRTRPSRRRSRRRRRPMRWASSAAAASILQHGHVAPGATYSTRRVECYWSRGNCEACEGGSWCGPPMSCRWAPTPAPVRDRLEVVAVRAAAAGRTPRRGAPARARGFTHRGGRARLREATETQRRRHQTTTTSKRPSSAGTGARTRPFAEARTRAPSVVTSERSAGAQMTKGSSSGTVTMRSCIMRTMTTEALSDQHRSRSKF